MPQLFNQPSMAAGEVGPHLHGRVDQELYYIGLRAARNTIIRQYGGAANRPGSRLTAETVDNSKKTRLEDFQFNEEQTYGLAFSDQKMRVIRNGGEVVETAKTVLTVTNANPAVVTFTTAHGWSDGDDIFIQGIVGMIELNGRSFRVANVTSTTVELTDYDGNNINSTDYAAYTSGGTGARIFTLSTPYLEADLFDLNFTSDNDTLTVTHNDYFPRDITRTDHDAWTLSKFSNSEGPFKDINITTTTVTPSAVSGTGIDLVASAGIFTQDMADDEELFFIQQEPEDTTEVWEVSKGVRDAGIVKAGSHYYQASSHSVSESITAITKASPGVITVSDTSGFTNNDTVYISGVVGMTEVNDKFFKVLVKTATTLQLLRTDEVDQSTAGYTTYTSGGTIEKAHFTGTLIPTHLEGTSKDGADGVEWTYLHSGFGVVQIKTFTDTLNVTADVVRRLPDNTLTTATSNWAKQAWSEAEGHPAAAAYHKERLAFGGTKEQPNGFWFSGINLRTFFGKSSPVVDDEAISGKLNTNGSNSIRHFVPFAELIALTSASEHLINGVDDVLLASQPIIQKPQGRTGASSVPPLIIQNTGLFVQDIGSSVRTLEYQLQKDAFGGLDMTARSPHLFEGKEIVDWAYQRHPFSVIWCVLSDGSLVGFTFMEEQKVFAWHRHDSAGGVFESVACLREGDETACYLSVKRTINGSTKRYIERFASRQFMAGSTDPAPVRDAYFVDCGITVDGRSSGAAEMIISGGTDWDDTETLTITANADTFITADVGAALAFWVDNKRYSLEITGVTSPTIVSAVPGRTIPTSHRATPFSTWELARKVIQPLWHLEGQTVNALVDGNVEEGLTVTDGKVTLENPGAVVHVGLPYVSDIETLDMAGPQGQTKAKPLNVNKVFITAQESRGWHVTSGKALPSDDSTTGMQQPKARDPEDGYDLPVPAGSDLYEVSTQNRWSRKGRIGIRQALPLPMTINTITTEAHLGSS